jgi:hypothetical protein
VEITSKEAAALLYVLDEKLEEMADTKELMIQDPITFRTVEEFSETIQDHEDMKNTLIDLRKKVTNEFWNF